MALYKDTNLTLYEVKHCVSGTCKANTRQWIHKLKLTCACDHSNITSHIFRHPCFIRRPRVVRDWNHPIYMGLLPGAHFWGQGGGGGGGAIFLKVSQAKIFGVFMFMIMKCMPRTAYITWMSIAWLLCSWYHLGSYFYSGFCSHLQSKHAHSQWNLHIFASNTLGWKRNHLRKKIYGLSFVAKLTP